MAGPGERVWGVDYNPSRPTIGNRAEIEELKSAICRVVARFLGAVPKDQSSQSPGFMGRVLSIVRPQKRQRHVILLPDVSDSTSAASPETITACQEYCEYDSRAVLVIHENGVPRAVFGQDVQPGSFGWCEDKKHVDGRVLSQWVNGLREFDPSVAIVFGDNNAELVYRLLSEDLGYHLIWLDSYNAKAGMKRIPLTKWRDWGHPPFAVWHGINSAPKAAAALRQTVRSMG